MVHDGTAVDDTVYICNMYHCFLQHACDDTGKQGASTVQRAAAVRWWLIRSNPTLSSWASSRCRSRCIAVDHGTFCLLWHTTSLRTRCALDGTRPQLRCHICYVVLTTAVPSRLRTVAMATPINACTPTILWVNRRRTSTDTMITVHDVVVSLLVRR